ncbi:MAG: MBL fold metallo-hydrolase [Gluconacetobacter diazotrophicus]|nr:MBL fold metallo-hydrolase [Gluconacetobacter diazotrophicus]
MPRRHHDGPPSDHFDGERFFNPGHPPTDRSLRDILRWRRTSVARPWPDAVPVHPAQPASRVSGLRVSVVGHATLLIQAAGRNLLTDPVWSNRAGPFGRLGPRRVAAPGIRFEALPPIDAVLLSHSHYDHLDLPTLRRLHDRDAPLLAMPLGVDRIVRRAIPAARVAVGDWHGRLPLAPGLSTVLTPAHHWSARGPGDRRRSLWCGHWLDTPAGSVWFAGDTGYGNGALFRDLRARHGSPDLALIPIGAYEPRWFMGAQHVDPAEAVRILLDTGARRALGIHCGTFRLTDEGRDDPPAALRAALAAAAVPFDRFVPAEPGAVHDVVAPPGA